MSFLKRLFRVGGDATSENAASKFNPQEAIFEDPVPNREATNRYFDLMGKIQGAIAAQKYDEAADIIVQTLDVVEPWLKEDVGEYGKFLISSIPVFEQGGRILAFLGKDIELARMEEITKRHPEFGPWRETVAEHRADQVRFVRILGAVREKPGILQTDMKKEIGEEDGRRIAALIGFLEKSGKLSRQKSGKTYKLLPPGMMVDAAGVVLPRVGLPQAPVASHRRDKGGYQPRVVNFAQTERVPLPRSPVRWEVSLTAAKRVEPPQTAFEVRDAQWQIVSAEKLVPEARPDPAFRELYPTASGLLMVDDLGNAEEFGEAPAAVLRFDLDGELVVKAPLTRDIYRFSAHPLGNGFVTASKDMVLQVYDNDLKVRLETALGPSPEVKAVQQRLQFADSQLKNHVRCVALSPNESRYLVTVVDEAWCVTMGGDVVWGVKMPVKEGYAPAGDGERPPAETSDQVAKALDILGLALPVSPEEVKRRYRELAKQYHPDMNGGGKSALERMKELNLALEAVTGLTPEAAPDFTGVRYTKELQRSAVKTEFGTLNITMSMVVSESFAADWVYAAAFGADGNAAYLATYTGRVVQMDGSGAPKRSYEIGAVPKAIVDTGEFLYIQTDTRLYVLKETQLYRLLDTYDGGDLIVWKQGFGLLEKKRFRWFGSDGTYFGSVVSKDPLRRAYWKADSLVVETRQARAVMALH
ncbi:MAG TPA: J domain-containing protein [Rhizomicrobium sp.]|nr:J domain-containing protein [Rhizomicrobium sp.]